MQCPVCSVDLVMTDRQGVEIDYCPKCRGIWLDRGELDKLIEREAAFASGNRGSRDGRPVTEAPRHHGDHDHHDHDDYRDNDYDYGRQKRRNRGGFLGDLLGGFGGDD